jgi:3-polyprenyl-4-hydroxybenzoate decarboxylase
MFTPGCLVVDGIPLHEDLNTFIAHESLASWPLVILVDDAIESTSSSLEFLWQVFTRFEPARDLYAKSVQIFRNAASFIPPLLIDARMKPSYYPVLCPSEETVELVNRRWHEYFPS